MLFVVYLASFFWLTRSTDDRTNLIRVSDGETVTLTCKLPDLKTVAAPIFWMKSSALSVPEVLAGTYYDCSSPDPENPRFTVTCDESRNFVLHLSRAQLSDTGLYYCMKVDYFKIEYINVTFLDVKGPELDIQTVSLDRSGHSVNLQCSVSHSENTCSGERTVHWFTSRHGQPLPNVLYTHESRGDECVQDSTTGQKKCVYNLSVDVPSSDLDTHYCTVVSCGHILFGNISKNNKDVNQCDQTVLFVLAGVLAVSLGLTALLTFIILKQRRELRAAGSFQTTATGDQRQQGSNHLVYAMPTFSRRKADDRNPPTNVVENVIYSDAKVKKYRNRM